MGINNAPDIFQEKMAELFYGFEFVKAYLDDLLVLTNGDWEDHLAKLEKVLQKGLAHFILCRHLHAYSQKKRQKH